MKEKITIELKFEKEDLKRLYEIAEDRNVTLSDLISHFCGFFRTLNDYYSPFYEEAEKNAYEKQRF